MSDTTFDYIVIGGGTAGALMANRLSADARHRVLLIEAGRRDDYHWIHIPVGYLHCIGNPRTDWLYQTEPEPGLNGRSLRYPRGKTLGGSTSINGMIYMRGQARDYDGWAAATGEDAWRWDNVLPFFKMHEDHHAGGDAMHGARPADWVVKEPSVTRAQPVRRMGGEWRVERQRLHWHLLDAFAQAAQQSGIPATADFNRGDNEGVGYFEVNQKSGWRWNTAKAFLRPVCYGRPNFEMWTNAQVMRLVLAPADTAGTVSSEAAAAQQASGHGSRLRCSGVEVWDGQEKVMVHAAREVVLCAGSIGSPQLLQLSGVGPADLLQAHGIPVACDLPGVGANLQDHLQLRSVYQVTNGGSLNQRSSSWLGKARIALEYALHRTGPMSMAPSQLGAFTRSTPGLAHANLQYHVQPLSLEAFGDPLHAFDAFTASVCNVNPTSRGTVQIRSARHDDAPAIALGYLSTEADRRTAADALRVTRRIVAQPALAPYQPVEYRPGAQFDTDEALERAAQDIGTTIFHPVGTTRMGRADDRAAVVDARLRLFDGHGGTVAGLRVADAGVMPSITSGNTSAPTLMIAERAARWMRDEASVAG